MSDAAADTAVFALPAELTIYQAQAVRDELRAAWDSGVRRFDISGVSAIDGAGAQLLASVQRQCVDSQSAAQAWVGQPQAEVAAALRLLGIRLS